MEATKNTISVTVDLVDLNKVIIKDLITDNELKIDTNGFTNLVSLFFGD